MIEAAGGRIGRADLAEGGRDDEGEKTADDPADRRLEAAARPHRERERRDAAGQDADDRERDREIREAAHAAGQLLGVAHLMQRLDVVFL